MGWGLVPVPGAVGATIGFDYRRAFAPLHPTPEQARGPRIPATPHLVPTHWEPLCRSPENRFRLPRDAHVTTQAFQSYNTCEYKTQTRSRGCMIQSAENTYRFHLGRKPYLRTSLLAWVLIVTFLCALRAGYRSGMVILEDNSSLTARDLSPKNLASIYWMIGTALSCFLAALVGLVPEILIGWTIHLPHPALVFICTAVSIGLSLAGLAVTLVAGSFIVIGFIGSFSFGRKLGAPQTYKLTNQTVLRIDGFVLTVIYPDKPESMIDLDLLDPEDQPLLLSLLKQRWLGAERAWNPEFGDEIEAALEEAERSAVLI